MIGSDYDTPVMYQDLGAYTPPGMYNGMMPGMMGMYPSYLGGVKMQPILCEDKVELINKKNKEGNKNAKKLGLAIGGLFLLGFIPYFRRNIKKAGGVINYIKNLFNPPAKLSRWQRFKNWILRRKPTPPTP